MVYKHIPGPKNEADIFKKMLMLAHCTDTQPSYVAMTDFSIHLRAIKLEVREGVERFTAVGASTVQYFKYGNYNTVYNIVFSAR